MRQVEFEHVAGEVSLGEQGANVDGETGRANALGIPQDVDVGQLGVSRFASDPFE